MRLVLALACLLPLVALTAACARDPQMTRWEADFYYTERLHVDGQHALASARYAALRQQAAEPRDADEAAVMQCETLARGLQHEEAARCFDALAIDGAERPVRMRALLHAAELRLYELGRERDGLKLLEALVLRAPDTAAGLRAVDHLTLYGHGDAGRRDRMIALMLRLEALAPRSELADNLLLRAATLLERADTRAARQQAVELLERHEERHADDQTHVDALMLRARLLRALDRPHDEALCLERVVATYETSHIFASYALDEHKVATQRLIELYRGPLRNLGRAEAHARHLPQMLYKPMKYAEYLLTVGDIQEQRGDPTGALSTYETLLATVAAKARDMADNDRRICRESETAEMRKRCFDALAQYQPFEPREAAQARERIARLRATLRGPRPGVRASQRAEDAERRQP